MLTRYLVRATCWATCSVPSLVCWITAVRCLGSQTYSTVSTTYWGKSTCSSEWNPLVIVRVSFPVMQQRPRAKTLGRCTRYESSYTRAKGRPHTLRCVLHMGIEENQRARHSCV